MFTGIVEHVGAILAVKATPAGSRLRIDLGPLSAGLVHGASIAVDGVCLTASDFGPGWADFDVIPETLSRSTLGRLKARDPVNLERALSAASRLDGHFVQGHVDTTATVTNVARTAREVRLGFRLDNPDLAIYLAAKGSVAVSGVSLTIADIQDAAFGVALIPTTLAKTTLDVRRVGDKVNIETDMLAKIVIGYLKRTQTPGTADPRSPAATHTQHEAEGPSRITLDTLREGGWL